MWPKTRVNNANLKGTVCITVIFPIALAILHPLCTQPLSSTSTTVFTDDISRTHTYTCDTLTMFETHSW